MQKKTLKLLTYLFDFVGGVAYGTPRNASTGFKNLKFSSGKMSPCKRPYRVWTIRVPSRAFLYRSIVDPCALFTIRSTTSKNNAYTSNCTNLMSILRPQLVVRAHFFDQISTLLGTVATDDASVLFHHIVNGFGGLFKFIQ